MARNYETESGARIAPLGDLRDFEVAEGYPDIRGWRVDSVEGTEVGKVHELLVDVDVLRTRYLDVRLTAELAATPGNRDVLVPIGAAQLDDKTQRVVLPLRADRVGLLPPYDHGALTRAHEYEVRRHFSLGEAAAASAVGAASTASTATPADRDFYDDERFDDRRFFSGRGAASKSARDVRTDDTTVRIPVAPDDTVVLKRGEGGHDEVIVRRPVDKRNDAR
jgi:hypothetical protein